MRSRFTPEQRAAIIAEHHDGATLAELAAHHGISRSAISGWMNPKKNARGGGWTWTEEQVALTGGRWVNVRGVMRWEPFANVLSVRDPSDRRSRIEQEDSLIGEAEARELHARYFNGCREPRTVVGERVYQRRKKRAQYAKRSAA